MRIDGKKIADGIKRDLNKQIGDLISHGITPKIAIITLGPEGAWESYVRQKLKVAGELGIKAILLNLEDADSERLLKTIHEVDSDPAYHGIIVQRPLPPTIDRQKVIDAISDGKDIDGFRPDSKFEVPVWLAVRKIIESGIMNQESWDRLKFVVLGKGETAGGPIAAGLAKMGVEPKIIDSKSENRDEILKNADVIISCVGKSGVITSDVIKPGSVLIGVGTHTENGKIKGDYDEAEIEPIAAAYTPTPGGIGPVNLSYLFKNLVEAANS